MSQRDFVQRLWFVPLLLGLFARLTVADDRADHDAAFESVELSVAAEPTFGTLDSFVTLALDRNPRLGAAGSAVEVARGRALQAGLYPNPEISGGAAQLNGNQSQYVARIGQKFVTAGKLRLDRDAALRAVLRAELGYVRAKFDLLTDVRRQFYLVLTAQHRVAILEHLVEIAGKSESAARRLLEIVERDGVWRAKAQRGTGKNFLSRDFRPEHLRVIYDLFDNKIVKQYLEGELSCPAPKLIRQFDESNDRG